MNRTRWLLLFVVILAAAKIAHSIWTNWGLITVHSDKQPLSEVIRSIEKQGGVTIRTNLDLAQPVRMHVEKVALPEALETLSTLTESRWRLAYIFASDKPTITTVLGKITAGERPEGWRNISYPVPSIPGAEEDLPLDPRSDEWNVKPPAEKTLTAYLEQAGQSVSASFLVPETWNPAVTATLKPGRIAKLAPKLAKAANGRTEEVFLLQGNRREGPRDQGDGERRADRRDGNREGMAARMQAEIDKLPPEKKAAAQAEFEERRAQFAAMRDLTPEQRRAQREEMFSRPEAQERMEKGETSRDARSSPEQRMKRAQRYVQRKQETQEGKR